ncbi:glyoxalase [uncultured Aquimarina sp.]|uniref:glyoxalase n=1 Tax=uncultured Aquimarina sp. TaxID=575652 RepID=UPI00262F676D|nr:glyoxalase [uncultured Aquimarina sp.]
MENRESNLLAIRPQILNARVTENMSEDEQFQNKTIRPIIKLQNELLIEVFRNYIKKRKNTFYELSVEKRLLYIENAVQKDMKFRNSLKGMIIGQFTVDEYLIYIKNSSALNKRMMNIVRERLQSNLQLLEKPLAVH